ncbi:hypothetical protein HZC35_01150 [Candidatus Saganbacteria bacterium]|nr:hypothetical protein [Candidatus Saganbacteria bacterium]
MIKVPASISVRIIRADPEAALPQIVSKAPDLKPENTILRKIISGLTGIVISLAFLGLLKLIGVSLGNLETYLIVGIPAILGFIAPYLMF